MKRIPRLYAIADGQFGDPVETGRRLFEGGARLVQIRDKSATPRTLLGEVEALLRHAPADAVVVVNDRVDVAKITGAGGVHLGQTDLPPESARAIVGDDVLVGVSTHDAVQARAALGWPVDYLAVGPIFPTGSKANPDPATGLAVLQEVCRHSSLPVVAIGGIRLDDVGAVMAAGAAAVAVISDLVGHGSVERRTRQYLKVLESLS